MDSDNAHQMDVNRFLKMVRKYTAINELTPEVLRHYIDKIVVHHREETAEGKTQKVDFYFNFKGKTQKVDFYFNFIRTVEMPMLYELAPYKNSFGRQKENHTAKAV